jgi:hypothetical protein
MQELPASALPKEELAEAQALPVGELPASALLTEELAIEAQALPVGELQH